MRLQLSLGLGLGAQSQAAASAPYGIRFRDLWKSGADYLGFEYERTGSLAGYAASAAIPENLLPVHKRMRRCVIDSDGVLQYYLDADIVPIIYYVLQTRHKTLSLH